MEDVVTSDVFFSLAEKEQKTNEFVGVATGGSAPLPLAHFFLKIKKGRKTPLGVSYF
jgi:hypothetical protein